MNTDCFFPGAKRVGATTALLMMMATMAAPARAQSSSSTPPTPLAQAGAQSDGKARLVERLLTLWHPEDVVVVMVQRPAADAMQQARIALQGRVSAEKRDAALKDIAVDVQKYVDEATPIARDAAKRQLSRSVAPMLQQQFTEDELKQLIAILESPLKKKFEQMIPQMERALGQKVAEESRAAIDPKMQAMTQAVGLKLRAATLAP